MTNVIIQQYSVETERNILMESYNSNNDRPKISLNRKKRMWNRYRNYVIGLIILVVAAIIFAVVLKSCSGKNGGKDDNKSTTAPVKQESTQGVQDETQRSDNSSQEATQQTTQAASGRSLAVSGTPQSEDYTSSAAYGKSVFIGDFVVSGISQFGFVGDSQVVSSNSMTSDKLTGYIDDIVSQSPDSVYIMVGINDLNYGSRSVDDIYKYEKEFIEAVKSALPSVLPISQRFESSSKVKQANIDSLNGMFSENASTLGITYIDVATVFKDGSGYFGSSYTDSGYNLKSGYYAFMLNGIAGVK